MKLTRNPAGSALSPLAAAILSTGLFIQSASAQVRFSAGSPYLQDFNSLSNSGSYNPWTNNSTLPGWYAAQTAGDGAITNYRAGTGSGTAGGLYSFGASNSTDRALGSLASGGPGKLAYGVRFTNDTSLAITNLTVNYTGEQWRCSITNTQSLAFSYLVSGAALADADAGNAMSWVAFTNLDFASPTTGDVHGPLDGTTFTNQQTFINVLLPGVAVQPGEEIFFRWYDTDDSGADHALAIDNVALAWTSTTPGAAPSPVRIAEWDFNATNTYAATSPQPCFGSGSACPVGIIIAEFAAGAPADPAGPAGPTNSAWNTRSYPKQGTTNKQAGVQFNLSTAGFQNVRIGWQQRNSPTASKYLRLQYSADGTNFTDDAAFVMNDTDTFDSCSADLSAVPAANNNARFAFRLVSEFESTAVGTTNQNYVATGDGSSYSTAGTIRFDLVTVYGHSIGTTASKPLSIRLWGNQAVLAWTNSALTLQSAPAAAGPYTDVSGAASPYTNPAAGAQKFFRLRP